MRRQNVLNALLILIVLMVVINLFTLFLVAQRGGLNLSDKNGRDLIGGFSSYEDFGSVVVNDSVLTLRFITEEDGNTILHTPRPLLPTNLFRFAKQILKKLNSNETTSLSGSKGYLRTLGRLKRAMSTTRPSSQDSFGADVSAIWSRISNWPVTDSILFSNFGQIIQLANRAKILQAKSSKKGTQLKIEMVLEGDKVAFFKPKWYPHDVLIKGNVYSGKDRHFGEIASFYLNLILNYDSAPISLGRKVDLAKEVLPFASNQLKETFFPTTNGSLCFYGMCYYCKKSDPVCAEGDFIEGAVILLMSQKFQTIQSPWRRTYNNDERAPWELDDSFCHKVLSSRKMDNVHETMLDIVAVSIFDFLIGNGDRHHYEMYSKMNYKTQHLESNSRRILLIDNGKSFGNWMEDYVDILAPLLQCCRIRSTLLSTLKKFQGGNLGKSLDELSAFDPLYPLLNHHHLHALDRRLNIVLNAVQVCIDNNPSRKVVY